MAKKKDLREEIVREVGRFAKRLSEEVVELAKRSEDIVKVTSHKLGKEAAVIAKKGEKQLVRASRMVKVGLDIVNLKRKKEVKLQEIGEKVYRTGVDKVSKASLKKLCQETESIEKEIKKKQKEMKGLKGSPKASKGKKKKV